MRTAVRVAKWRTRPRHATQALAGHWVTTTERVRHPGRRVANSPRTPRPPLRSSRTLVGGGVRRSPSMRRFRRGGQPANVPRGLGGRAPTARRRQFGRPREASRKERIQATPEPRLFNPFAARLPVGDRLLVDRGASARIRRGHTPPQYPHRELAQRRAVRRVNRRETGEKRQGSSIGGLYTHRLSVRHEVAPVEWC